MLLGCRTKGKVFAWIYGALLDLDIFEPLKMVNVIMHTFYSPTR